MCVCHQLAYSSSAIWVSISSWKLSTTLLRNQFVDVILRVTKYLNCCIMNHAYTQVMHDREMALRLANGLHAQLCPLVKWRFCFRDSKGASKPFRSQILWVDAYLSEMRGYRVNTLCDHASIIDALLVTAGGLTARIPCSQTVFRLL